jgi:hypothetical protein
VNFYQIIYQLETVNMTRAVSSSLKVKKSKKIVEDSDRESTASFSDSEKSDYEEDECSTSSESEDEETPPPQKEKVKKEKSKTAAQAPVKAKASIAPKPEKRKHCKDKKTSAKRKRKAEMFDDSNVKIDMSNDNIKPQKIKLTSNLLIECRTIVVDEPDKKKFSYPGIVFIRKMKDDKCFEFNIPLAIASRVISAIEIMTNEKNNFKKKE